MCESDKRKDLGCTDDVEIFPSQISDAYLSPDRQYGDGHYHVKDDSVREHSRAFACMARRSTLRHQRTNHTSLLFFACLHFHCWTNTLYTMLTAKAIKKQLCGLVRFHYACLLPYRWQYRYVTTVLTTFARNMFYGGCSVLI